MTRPVRLALVFGALVLLAVVWCPRATRTWMARAGAVACLAVAAVLVRGRS